MTTLTFAAAVINHQTLDALAAFCADQRYSFDSSAWLKRSASEGKALGVVAQYLAMTSWYGHDAELEQVAEKICPGISNLNTFSGQTEALGVNLAQLSVATRFGPSPRRPAGLAPTAWLA